MTILLVASHYVAKRCRETCVFDYTNVLFGGARVFQHQICFFKDSIDMSIKFLLNHPRYLFSGDHLQVCLS